jgi:hypothetical protein
VEVGEEQPNEYSEFVLVPELLVGSFAVQVEPMLAVENTSSAKFGIIPRYWPK